MDVVVCLYVLVCVSVCVCIQCYSLEILSGLILVVMNRTGKKTSGAIQPYLHHRHDAFPFIFIRLQPLLKPQAKIENS